MARSKTRQAAASVQVAGAASGQVSINPQAASHAVSRLTDLYEDPVLATVRETIQNALDATGPQDAPVEVDTPTDTCPVLTVRDHGCGMSRQEMVEVFATYGVSTKQDDLTKVGAYGLGAKAPLSYTGSFMVSSVKDGELTTMRIWKDDSGVRFTVSSQQASGEANGTTVTVPVVPRDFHSFDVALETYRQFSHRRPVVIDGQRYEGLSDFVEVCEVDLDDDGTTGKVFIYKDSAVKHLTYAFKDGTLGPLPLSWLLDGYVYGDDRGVVVEIVPGLVDFPSSRDEIVVNERSDSLRDRVQLQLEQKLGTICENLAGVLPTYEALSRVAHGNLRQEGYLSSPGTGMKVSEDAFKVAGWQWFKEADGPGNALLAVTDWRGVRASVPPGGPQGAAPAVGVYLRQEVIKQSWRKEVPAAVLAVQVPSAPLTYLVAVSTQKEIKQVVRNLPMLKGDARGVTVVFFRGEPVLSDFDRAFLPKDFQVVSAADLLSRISHVPACCFRDTSSLFAPGTVRRNLLEDARLFKLRKTGEEVLMGLIQDESLMVLVLGKESGDYTLTIRETLLGWMDSTGADRVDVLAVKTPSAAFYDTVPPERLIFPSSFKGIKRAEVAAQGRRFRADLHLTQVRESMEGILAGLACEAPFDYLETVTTSGLASPELTRAVSEAEDLLVTDVRCVEVPTQVLMANLPHEQRTQVARLLTLGQVLPHHLWHITEEYPGLKDAVIEEVNRRYDRLLKQNLEKYQVGADVKEGGNV